MITWPDPFYHTSQDRYDKCDPTQLKRAVFINSISAFTIAAAGENEAINIAGEVYGNSVRRIGYQVAKAFDEVNQTGADDLVAVLKRASGNIRGVVLGERMTLNSILELAPGSERLLNLIEEKSASLSLFADAIITNLETTGQMRASDFGMERITITQSNDERRAMNTIPEFRSDPADLGYQGLNEKLRELPANVKDRYNFNGIPDPYEALACINGVNSVLDIKYILDAQNSGETDLGALMNVFRLVREMGLIRF